MPGAPFAEAAWLFGLAGITEGIPADTAVFEGAWLGVERWAVTDRRRNIFALFCWGWGWFWGWEVLGGVAWCALMRLGWIARLVDSTFVELVDVVFEF